MQVILWDIDGTLISTGGAGKQAMESALLSAFGITDPAQTVSYAGRTDRAISRDLFTAHALDDSPANWQTFRTAYLGHLPNCLRQRQGQIFPGVADLLSRLGGHSGVRQGLLTGNIRAGALHKLGHFDLDRHFAFGGFGDDHHDRSDVARAALQAARSQVGAELDPGDVWVIGDTIFDIRCARAIGARVVAVATGGHTADQLADEGPDHLFHDFTDLERALALWR